MAETAALLSPDKKVLIPDPNAGCPMANMAPIENVKKWQTKYPNAVTVCYVNSTVDVKAVSNICVTSANALKIVKSLPEKQIIFIPDQSLGDYIAKQLPEKEIILWPGFCPTHHRILEEFVLRAKKEHPEAQLLAHPECRENVLQHTDFIGSTGQIQKYAKETGHKEFIIASENGMLYRLEKDNPDKKFYSVSPMADCQNMKKNTLDKVLRVLEKEDNIVTVEKKYREPALAAIHKMLELS